MIGVQKQQKKKNVPNRSRRTPLNVVVEKIGTSTVVHGDLGKESLKELLMSELSLISKFQSPETKDSTTPLENTSLTQAFSEIIVKSDKENISEESKSEEEVRELKIDNERKVVESDKEKQELKSTNDPLKFGKTSQEKDKNITEELQKSQKDIFENEVTKKGEKDQDMKNKTNQNDKTLLSETRKYPIISSNEDSSIHGNQDKEKDSGKDTKIADKNESEEIVIGKDEEREELDKKQNKEIETTKKEFDKEDDDKKFQDKESDKETIRKTESVLQDERKKEEADHTVKYLFRKKDSKLRGKKCMSEREKRAIMKGKNSWHYGDLNDDETKQMKEISDSEDLAEDYEKEERNSCFSKISSDNEDILALSYDGKWLKHYLKKALILAMNEIVQKKPRDPINYLGFWLLNYRKSQENLKRKMDLEEELLSKRNEWNVLHGQVKEMPKLIIEEKESKHQEEEENIEDLNFSNYRFR